MFLEREGHYDLGMDALVTVCSWRTKVIMLWAWMLWSAYVLGTPTKSCFGHGYSGNRMLLEQGGYYAVGMYAWSPYAVETRTELCCGQ